jgi:hypothetical protein
MLELFAIFPAVKSHFLSTLAKDLNDETIEIEQV